VVVPVPRIGRWLPRVCAVLVAFCAGGLEAQPSFGNQNLTLGWSASVDPTVVGYYVYYGTTSGVYTNKIDAGANTNITVSGLAAGTTYYFTGTSYDAVLFESFQVPEVAYMVPPVLDLTLSSSGTNGSTNVTATIQFPVSPGQSYQLQASSDLTAWISVWLTSTQTTNGWIQYTEPYTNSLSAKFYRLIAN
jgi:hypothetical protein